MLTFETDHLGREYDRLLDEVVTNGMDVAPRGVECVEVSPLVLSLADPLACVVSRPRFSEPLMYMEMAQLLAGEFHPSLYEALSKNAAKMLTPYGAYGPRVREQLLFVEDELRRDPHSRRAVVYIGRPDDLRLSQAYDPEQLDMPCTEKWQFLLRGGKLKMIVGMRSWDLVWGLSYDIPAFVSVQVAMASALGTGLGDYAHVAGSGHVYKQHYGLAPESNDNRLDFRLDAGTPLDDTQRRASEALAAARATLGATRPFDWSDFVAREWQRPLSLWAEKFSKV